ncbi:MULTISPECIES: STAS domain-containing protein [unclassified Streptomyces]|uniref:STAS domain-containing protein n=1 Tax=unclassified Streptomyces TaxID=2593676 RepID=UPI0004C69F00|nr:STAS domain-containing protein [Streptomyces sp. NRRL F-2747]
MQGEGSVDIDVEVHGGATVVRPHGEMDISRADHFRQVLLSALSGKGPTHDLVVDLQHLSFCDSSGLNALLAARTVAASESSQNLYLAAPREQFMRLLKITGVEDLFTIEPVPPF